MRPACHHRALQLATALALALVAGVHSAATPLLPEVAHSRSGGAAVVVVVAALGFNTTTNDTFVWEWDVASGARRPGSVELLRGAKCATASSPRGVSSTLRDSWLVGFPATAASTEACLDAPLAPHGGSDELVLVVADGKEQQGVVGAVGMSPYFSLDSIHLLAPLASSGPTGLPPAVGLAAKNGRPNWEYDVIAINSTHVVSVGMIGGFPFSPMVSCVDVASREFVMVMYDGKYPCLVRIDLTNGTMLAQLCPSVLPEALVCVQDAQQATHVLGLESYPAALSGEARVYDLVTVNTTTGQSDKVLLSRIPNIASLFPGPVVSTTQGTTALTFLVTNTTGATHALHLADVLGESPTVHVSDPLDVDGLEPVALVQVQRVE